MSTIESRGWRLWSSRTLWAAATAVTLLVSYVGLRALIGEREIGADSHPTFNLLIAAPRPDEAMTILSAKQNEMVTLRIRSDRAGDVHVHGYDQNVTLEVGSEVVLTFAATTAGVYPIHLHERLNPADPATPIAHRQLAVLEVKAE